MSKVQYGGQAVIEGVMIRGKDKAAIAVRKSSQEIVLKEIKLNPLSYKLPCLKWPFIRGITALVSSLVLGMKSLSYSAGAVVEEEDEEITPLEMGLTMLFSFGLAILLFVALPAGIVSLLQPYIPHNIILNFFEGIIKITMFLAYVLLIARLKDIKRVFMYHGAEHKVIFNYEAGLPLTVANARKFSTLHPRCGTNFIFIVILISIFFFSFMGRPPFLQRILYHLLLLPVVAGTSYEVLKLAGRKRVNPLIKLVATPGLWLQKITTSEPDDSMLEIAIKAFTAVLPGDERGKDHG